MCVSGFFGNPYEGCRPECLLNSDCPQHLTCINDRCKDPCIGYCGENAECQAVNHIAKCNCLIDHVGNPYDRCILKEGNINSRFLIKLYLYSSSCSFVFMHNFSLTENPRDPCNPSPCGPHSTCRTVNEQAICTCLPTFVGTPPNCRPECVTSSDCPLSKACIREKCIDPCPGTCGENAQCRVHRHSPYCTCLPGFEGDPFIRCTKVIETTITTPCEPNPCGPFATCRDVGGSASCSCKPGYRGVPPQCAPECTINEDCPRDKACVREKCIDPCTGSCGANTECRAMNHLAICTCRIGYRGDPFIGCYEIIKGRYLFQVFACHFV